MKREINMQRYVPPIYDRFREMESITQAEEPEIDKLYQRMEDRLSDAFITCATLQGLRRYEDILGIKMNPEAELEERRIGVMRYWCLTLPYTIQKLLDELDAVAGKDGYELQTCYEKYEMELMVYDQSLITLHSIRKMVQDMIPANLFLIFTGEMREYFCVQVLEENRLTLCSNFYPRYNIPPLVLTGGVSMDGKYLLNGYMDNQNLDFYPLNMCMGSGVMQKTQLSGKLGMLFGVLPLMIHKNLSFGLHGWAELKAHTQNILYLSGSIDKKIGSRWLGRFQVETANEVKGGSCFLGKWTAELESRSDSSLLLSGNVCTELEIEEKTEFRSCTEHVFENDLCFSCKRLSAQVSSASENILQISGAAKKETAIDVYLVIEKDLWYLDGNQGLDGKVCLDAAVYETRL